MKLGLGIDTGGTYTDAVIMDLSDGGILDSYKTLTTHSNLVEGIENVIAGLKPEYLKEIKLVSVSTTLSTNSTLEGKGHPSGLVLAGYTVNGDVPARDMVSVDGGHDSKGNEVGYLDLAAVEEFVNSTRGRLFSYAVSSYFAIRNPEHELAVKETIERLTDKPVVCGHELSLSLGAYERAVTAVLNARLIPITSQFIRAVLSVMGTRNIIAPLMVMKCDGSLARIEEALEKPVESIFSGPSASLVGAAHISGLKTCVAVDVGGTSTDIALIDDGIPEISENGAVVGSWKTMVRAVRIRTSAMGGDSHVWVQRKLCIGPNRVIPLCLAATDYPLLTDKLRKTEKPSDRIMDDIFQPTSFFVRSGKPESEEDVQALNYAIEFELENYERQIFDAIGYEPVSVSEIAETVGKHPLQFVKALRSLVQKRCVYHIGFTPTDALHVLGEYEAWNSEASQLGAGLLGSYLGLDPAGFSREIKRTFAKNIALDLMAFFAKDFKREDLEKLLSSSRFTKFKINIPVVMIGAPVKAYLPELEEFIDADFRVPRFHEVGNAVGALVGNIIKRSEILIRPAGAGTEQYHVFSEKERVVADNYGEAVDYGLDLMEKLIFSHMDGYGLQKEQVRFDLKRKDINPGFGALKETRLTGLGVGSPLKLEE
ncbi:hydantoinase/oxoprolinase family protein [Methanosarcina sp. KYL-1]|uniref:hydantoinase/oxoprolinase family protein n=1 Tax=Methanosarcina sp. KYL-1 TaxID=2602068 RepID=UPI002100F4FD|nr:hydantoinase/oxoprolinase family protein [Methanosarcina sp. KYL-1]MCQ1536477.1 hydantoinase/oxoprolinase family protein [Methanosarcina sp. KYL-1]